MSTSLTYNFPLTFTFDKMVDTAFMRLGITPNLITPDHTKFARYAANLEMHEWAAKHTSLCWVQREMIEFVTGQVFYRLPDYVYKPLQATRVKYTTLTLRSSSPTVVLAGVPFATPSSGTGSVNNCFIPTSTAGFTQNAPNGFMGFAFQDTNANPMPAQVWYVGIRSLIQTQYTLAIEYSLDNVTWQLAKQCPTVTYNPNENKWFVVEVPPMAPYWRIREINGNTLAIQQIYFSNNDPSVGNIPMGKISRSAFMNYPQKINNQAIPTAYYFNEKETRSFYIYGNNYTQFNSMVYTAKVYPQDVDQLFQNVNTDVKFYAALITGMAYRLATTYKPDMLPTLQEDYNRTYEIISADDGEEVPLQLSTDLSQNWIGV
jgi:hypothetical protein